MTDLTDRMRTCASYLLTTQLMRDYDAVKDAADLLIEASNALEPTTQADVRAMLGEPMVIIEPKPMPPSLPEGTAGDLISSMTGTWIDPGGPLPQPRGKFNPRACPTCDSRATKKVVRLDRKLMLVCPACSATWEWKKPAG